MDRYSNIRAEDVNNLQVELGEDEDNEEEDLEMDPSAADTLLTNDTNTITKRNKEKLSTYPFVEMLLDDMIKRNKNHPPVANRTNEDYRKCQSKATGKKETEALLVIEGNILLLSCPLCLPPSAKADAIWRRFLENEAVFTTVHLDGSRVRILADSSLEFTNVWGKDSGIYLCLKDSEILAKYSLDVVKVEPHKYIVMKGGNKKDGRGPSKDVALKDSNLVVGMTWSEWSECSRCGKVGKRRRIGICTVRKLNFEQPTKPENCQYLNEYRKGIPCRSELLPKKLRDLPAVRKAMSEFIIGFCKMPCPTKASIVQVTDKTGKVIDTVDNSQGVYSMHQPLPKLPPLVKRRVVYKEVEMSVILACPGNIEGKFLIWRNESYVINPSKVHIMTKGRVKIDLANNLFIRKLRYSDTATYSCWDDKKLVGTTRLQVVDKELSRSYRIYVLNTAIIFTFIILLMVSVTVCKNVRLKSKE